MFRITLAAVAALAAIAPALADDHVAMEADALVILAVPQEQAEYFNLESLEDRDVYGLAGEEVGEIEDVLFGLDGQIKGFVIETDELFGDKEVLMDASRLDITARDGELFITAPVTEEMLEEAESYDDDRVTILR